MKQIVKHNFTFNFRFQDESVLRRIMWNELFLYGIIHILLRKLVNSNLLYDKFASRKFTMTLRHDGNLYSNLRKNVLHFMVGKSYKLFFTVLFTSSLVNL